MRESLSATLISSLFVWSRLFYFCFDFSLPSYKSLWDSPETLMGPRDPRHMYPGTDSLVSLGGFRPENRKLLF